MSAADERPPGPLGPAVGIVELSTSVAMSAEAPPVLAPAAVAVIGRLRLPGGEVTARALDAMLAGDALERACEGLADAGVRAIAFACTTGSLLHGPGFDRALAARISAATGLPATTTATAMVEALAAAGARRVGLGTPYVADLNRREREFLAAAGFEVVAEAGLGIERDPEIAALGPGAVAALAAEVAVPAADALFLSCTNMPTVASLAALERRHGRPVLSSNAVTLWALLRLAGLPLPSGGAHGSLLAGAVAVGRKEPA